MFFDPIKFGLAASITVAAKFTFCSLGMAFYPRLFQKLHSHVSHYVIDGKMTIQNFVMGLVQASLHTFIAAWIFAYVYNYLLMQ